MICRVFPLLLPRQAIASGLLLTLFGGLVLPSFVSFQMHAIAATATVLEHVAECRVEYRLAVQDHSTEVPLDCDAALAMKKAMSENKVKLDREDWVRLSWVLPNGEPREAKVKADDVLALTTPVGATLPIVWDPRDPDHVKTPYITIPTLGIAIAMVSAGSYLLLRGFGLRPAVTVGGWIGGRSGRASGATQRGLAAATTGGELPPWTRQGRLVLLWGLVAALGLGSAMTWTCAGELLRDLRLAHTWRPAPDVRVENASCATIDYVVSYCDATLVPSDATDPRPYGTRFLLSFAPEDGEFLIPARSAAVASVLATLRSAEQQLGNRALTFGFVFVACLGIAISCVRRLAAGRYEGGSAHVALMATKAARADNHNIKM